jgi:hypothetical protein
MICFMQLQDAAAKATQVLEEERRYPTVGYKNRLDGYSETSSALMGVASSIVLQQSRTQRPRLVEDPTMYQFRSINYDLLVALLQRVSAQDRGAFLNAILLRIVLAPGCIKLNHGAPYPGFRMLSSDLPLVAEFAIRNGCTNQLCRILGESTPIAGHAALLRQIEDLIALNFTAVPEAEYQFLSLSVNNYAQTVKRTSEDRRGMRVLGVIDWQIVEAELLEAAEGIQEECRKAEFLYLKGLLIEGLNLEVNQDKDAVQTFLQRLGFSQNLISCLSKADQLYQNPSDSFDLKSSMGHLRSFLESMQLETLKSRFGIEC